MTADQMRAREYLAHNSAVLAKNLLEDNPWLCKQLGVEWAAWSRSLLEELGLKRATLHLMGSAAIGFSLSPDKPGRRFRTVGTTDGPSDLDIALVDDSFFHACWNEMLRRDRRERFASGAHERECVYWGRIDDHRVPNRSPSRMQVRTLLDSCRRSPEFRGYPVSLRIYRRRDDLLGYLVSSLSALERTLQ